MIKPRNRGGAGIDAVWADDFHHQVRSAIAGDNEGYYSDYTGSAADIAETLRKGWFFVGQLSQYKGQPRGSDASAYDPPHFIYCLQNHDQIGNRATGDRLTETTTPEQYRGASALLLLSPYTPLLFQGQEWAASTPFLFFTDFNPELGKLVTKGRREEFSHFKGFSAEEVPDPQAPGTFEQSKLDWDEAEQADHKQTLALYRELLRLRHTLPALKERGRENLRSVSVGKHALAIRQHSSQGDLLLVVNLEGELKLNFSENSLTRPPESGWKVILSSEDPRFGGKVSAVDLQKAVEQGRISADGPVAVALVNG
jgi:maltooligosyltrehalose trehalohydrolase